MNKAHPTQFKRRVTAAEAFEQLADSERFTAIFRHGTLEGELYAPHGHDPQKPHVRGEVYVVVSGSLARSEKRGPPGPDDVLFVPAELEHRFEDFTDNFSVWTLFYGPERGEQNA